VTPYHQPKSLVRTSIERPNEMMRHVWRRVPEFVSGLL
jgi:hypothetical protein